MGFELRTELEVERVLRLELGVEHTVELGPEPFLGLKLELELELEPEHRLEVGLGLGFAVVFVVESVSDGGVADCRILNGV